MARYTHLGAFLKRQRIRKGFTQSSLAQSLHDIHPQFISNWERGLCMPPAHCLHELFTLLKLNPRKLENAMVEDIRLEVKTKISKALEAS